ncbi:MAG: N-6 DNA methylase [Bacteroidales bacterium]|nr:N-6 DNA methylase [Bacteroidales bacterium]
MLISSILIALECKPFKKTYGDYNNAENLSKFLTQTVSNELENANITGKKLDNLNIQFSFINTDTSLSKKENVLKNIIDEIDENINTFIKTHRYFDVLGQLYIEFLSYANSDKGLGIVLTPPHITELFSDLAGVNKNTIVYDNCTGTGGFLISAMSKMIKDAKNDQDKIDEIKANQLIGTEYQSHIFALAISNMYIHQDGKTNIINGSCFDEEIIKQVKERKPTVGFLNPPYKSNKKTDTDELEFILNNLECINDGGTSVAIVPMQSALATKGKVYELKKKLLEKHTLEAVLSMPDELFFNSKVGVVSCIMVFTAHRQHSKHKETYFGYYKNDGFVKRKTKGRIDAYGNWEKIKEKWLSNYINKKHEPGLSVNKSVTAEMEWVAEAYMETKYSVLNKNMFSQTLIDYATFLFGNKLSNEVSSKAYNNEDIVLDTKSWISFKLDELFTITGRKTTPLLELEEYGNGVFPYVTTQATNNGIEGFYDFSTEKGNVLTVDSAVLGYCSYQELDFSASDHVEKLIPNFEMNKYIAMFLVTIMNLERYRYNYGRKCSQTRMKEISIKLPSKDNKPDFALMENYIKTLPYSLSIKMKESE